MRGYRVRAAAVILVVLGFGVASATAQAPVQPTSYEWSAELVAVDASARKATVRVSVMDHVVRYVTRFKADAPLVVLWDPVVPPARHIGQPGPVELPHADHIRALWEYDEKSTLKPAGYVLPVTFVSADVPAKNVTFSVRVPADALAVLQSATPGQRLEVTAPIDQPSRDARITTIRVADGPKDSSTSG